MMVRDSGLCCFGSKPRVYDKIKVILREGTTTRYIEGHPFDVVGTMTVKPIVDEDTLIWLYSITDAQVLDQSK